METENSTIKKRYTHSFALDKAKLSRILDIAEDKFEKRTEKLQTTYVVDFDNGKNVTLTSLEDVLNLDNTTRNPIISISLSIIGDNDKCILGLDDSSKNNISLTIVSQDAKWANQIFAEIEEQIERVFLENWIYKLRKTQFLQSTFALVILSMGVASIFSIFFTELKTDDSGQALALQAQSANTTEEKIDFLFEMHKLDIKESDKPNNIDPSNFASDIGNLVNIKTIFLVLPLIIIIGCFVYLYSYCYPDAVFLWGDCLDWYEDIIKRRRTIWTVVIASFLISIMSNLFVFGLSEFL